MPSPNHPDRFRYGGYAIDAGRGEVSCHYSTGDHQFTERFAFDPAGDWANPAVEATVRLLFLLAGVSYYKTAAAPVIDLGDNASAAPERAFLTRFYQEGLGEFAYRNGLDLSELSVEGPDRTSTAVDYTPLPNRPLIPFGGGIDSIVTVSAIRAQAPDAALCIVHPPGDRFAAIEGAAAVTGLPVVYVEREIDPLVRSGEHGFLNGHVPITAVITATALVAAVLAGRDAVVLSNEWSASVPTVVHQGHPVNHQWSKSSDFESLFAERVAASLGPKMAVFSYLRNRTELWVAQQFAGLPAFHPVFRSCNRSFAQDPTQRLDHWCGRCDKCCFIDLILSPYLEAAELRSIFVGHEPLDDPQLEEQFRTLLGLGVGVKPFECVGDTYECRAAVRLAAARPDRKANPLLARLVAAVEATDDAGALSTAELLVPVGRHYIPDRYAPADLLV
jgi:hypothetical protein